MIIIGVDPGTKGSLAAIKPEGPELISCLDMPIINFGTKTRRCVDGRVIGDWISDLSANHEVPKMFVVEHQNAMTGDFINTAFMQGLMFGSVLSAIVPHDIAIHFTTAPVWKKKAGLIRADKKASIARGRQLFGNHIDLLRQKDETRAEAAMIAFYGPPERALGTVRREQSAHDLFAVT